MKFPAAFLLLLALAPPVRSQEDDEIRRHNQAVEWNQKGVDLLEEEKYSEALSAFHRALQLKPKDKIIRKNLGIAYFQHGQDYLGKGKKYAEKAATAFRNAAEVDPDQGRFAFFVGYALYEGGKWYSAIQELESVLRRFPKEKDAYLLLGKIYYDQGKPRRAVPVLEKGLQLEPGNDALKKLLEKARKEKHLDSSGTNHFDFFYDGVNQGNLAQHELEIGRYLEDAYAAVGENLGHPQKRIQVIFYRPKDFSATTRADEWVGGLFDGKIRIPVRDFAKEKQKIRKVILHEYTHAAIYQITPQCPVWLNEGLAQLEEGIDPAEVLQRLKKSSSSLLDWKEMQGPFVSFGEKKARMAYDMALHLTWELQRQFGSYVILQFLKDLGRQPGNEAEHFRKRFGQSFALFFSTWKTKYRL